MLQKSAAVSPVGKCLTGSWSSDRPFRQPQEKHNGAGTELLRRSIAPREVAADLPAAAYS
jgi:hypothetical protein